MAQGALLKAHQAPVVQNGTKCTAQVPSDTRGHKSTTCSCQGPSVNGLHIKCSALSGNPQHQSTAPVRYSTVPATIFNLKLCICWSLSPTPRWEPWEYKNIRIFFNKSKQLSLKAPVTMAYSALFKTHQVRKS